MPYFIILPVYGVLLISLFTAVAIARQVPRFRAASGYIFGGAVGTLIGFGISNIIVWLVGLAPVWLFQKFTVPDWLAQLNKFFVTAALLVGPLIGSSAGVLVGFAVGVYFVYRRRRHGTITK